MNILSETLLKGPNDAKIDDVEKWTKPLLDEFLHNLDFEETIKEISEKFSNNTITMFLETVFNEVILDIKMLYFYFGCKQINFITGDRKIGQSEM